MTAGFNANLLFYLLVLLLPIAALAGRRVPLLRVLGMGIAWLGIFAVGLFVLAERERFDPFVSRVAAALQLDSQSVAGGETRIRMAPDGHFWAKVTIAGVRRRMLIDSGATVTALSTDTAAAAGLDVRAPTFPMLLRTANGTVSARVATVGEMRLGDVVARDLSVVVSPAFGDSDVLGMNFLSRLKSWRVEGRTLILTPHHPQFT